MSKSNHIPAYLRPVGPRPSGAGWDFTVWAPRVEALEIEWEDGTRLKLDRDEAGYWQGSGPARGERYHCLLDGTRRPDPASRHQPEGVHGPSRLPGRDFPWKAKGWKGLPLADFVIYEIHVGTFTEEGTFGGVESRLDYLKELGVTAVEIMPVNQFPGERNWGYDGAQLFAAQNSYGGPEGFKSLVDACHRRGIAVVLDVVYNHLGPEGNYLRDFGPYFTDRYHTPWGEAVNFDGAHSDAVRNYFIQNALYWVGECRVDALRLDAVHSMLDLSATHFLEDLNNAVQGESGGRQVHLIAETDQNDPRIVRPPSGGGHGLAGFWSDDLHHSLHSLLTGEKDGYYGDFGAETLARTYSDGFAYTGQYSRYRERSYGKSPDGVPGEAFCVCLQNHDQVGNRMLGERIINLTSPAGVKYGATAVLLSPFTPLLFMGEEYGEQAPFFYFIHHGDPKLVEAVREGRRREFARFNWGQEPPDPQDEASFRDCRPDFSLAEESPHREMRECYRRLITLRRGLRKRGLLRRDALSVKEENGRLELEYNSGDMSAQVVLAIDGDIPERGQPVFDSRAPEWGGRGEPGSPAAAVFTTFGEP